jgi:hypothetical protein
LNEYFSRPTFFLDTRRRTPCARILPAISMT